MAAEMVCGCVIVLATIFYNNSKIFRYYTKLAFFVTFSLIFATIFIPLMLFNPRDYKNALLPAWGARQISRALGLKWEMKGHKNIVQDVGTVVLINHQSCLDLLVLAEIWPILHRCTVISKREIFYLWPFGLACWLWGTVFINRMSGKDAQTSINKAAITINEKQAKICMFPEGTRHGGENLLPFKKGAFHVAVASQAPIQPIVVSRFKFIDHNTFSFNSGKEVISILPAIETAGLRTQDLETVMNNTYEVMTKEYNLLNQISN